MAQASKGMEKQQLIERAEEALQDSYGLRVEMLGE